VVQKIKDAGAIVLFKSNMAEFAFTPLETVGSILPGYTFNPYALNHTTAGSSGGTAAGVAASFGAVGLGTLRCFGVWSANFWMWNGWVRFLWAGLGVVWHG